MKLNNISKNFLKNYEIQKKPKNQGQALYVALGLYALYIFYFHGRITNIRNRRREMDSVRTQKTSKEAEAKFTAMKVKVVPWLSGIRDKWKAKDRVLGALNHVELKAKMKTQRLATAQRIYMYT